MLNIRIVTFLLFSSCFLVAKSQDNYELQSEVCLSVKYKELGFTKGFESITELHEFQFGNNLLHGDSAVKSVKILKLTDLYEKYFGIHKYCQEIVVIEIKENEFKNLNEGIKQRLSGI